MSDIEVSYGTAVAVANGILNDIKTLIMASNVDLAALEVLVTAGNVDLAALETLVTATNVDLSSIEINMGSNVLLLADIRTALQILDNAISGNEMQCDVLSSALPSGAATQSTLSSLLLINGVDGGGDLQKIKEAVEVGALIAGVKTFDVGDGEVNFDSQVVVRYVDVVINDMGDATWVVIGTTGTPTVGIKCTAIGQGVQHLPVSNVNLIKMDTDATAGNDVTVAYIGV